MKDLFSFFSVQNGGLSGFGEAAPGFGLITGDDVFPGKLFAALTEKAERAVFESGAVRVTADYRPDKAHNAVVYRVSVKNLSDRPVRLHDVRSLDLRLMLGHEDVFIHSFFGGDIEFYYPPKNFSEICVTMQPAQRYPENWEVGYRAHSGNGRSSDNDLPFVILEDKAHTGGLYLSVIWSGDWYMEFSKQSDGAFHAFGGMQFLDILMDPGEEIVLPEVLVGAYAGGYDEGTNAVRRYIRDTCLRRFPVQQQIPPVSYDHWFGLGAMISEEIMKKQASRLDGLGFDYFVMDAGWYFNGSEDPHDFNYGTGNFTKVDNRKFPNGLKPLYGYLEEKGLLGGLWFEPERAGTQSIIAHELPEAMLSTVNAGDRYFASDLHLVDFGNPDVIAYTKKYLRHYFDELGLRWIRWDFNLNPRQYWKDHDRSGRRGESELAHMRGLYEVLEWVNTEYPQVLIEGCASGGQRMDLATMRHSPNFWCSDQTYNAHISRCQLTAGNRILPGILLNRALTPMLPAGEDIPDYYFMSLFGGAFSVDDPVQGWSEITRERCKRHVTVYKQLREFICDDYYQLLPVPRSLADNEAWEFINPETQRGFFQLFRSEGKNARLKVCLKGLATGNYVMTDPYTGVLAESTADELKNGIVFELEPFSSMVRLFRKKEC